MNSLYNCKRAGGKFRITKFSSDDMNVESSYLCTTSSCDCPAGVRPTCRHRDMLPKFLHRGYVGTEFFFDFDRGGWVQGEVNFVEPELMTAEDIEALPDGLEKDHQHEMQVIEPPSSPFMKRRFL